MDEFDGFDWRLLGGLPLRVKRNGATWEGKIVGYVNEPAVVLETKSGDRQVIVVRDATFERLG